MTSFKRAIIFSVIVFLFQTVFNQDLTLPNKMPVLDIKEYEANEQGCYFVCPQPLTGNVQRSPGGNTLICWGDYQNNPAVHTTAFSINELVCT